MMDMNTSDDRIIFHYCTLPAMINIVKEKQLWMGDIINSNDYNEARLVYPGIMFAAEDLYRDDPFAFFYDGLEGIDAIRKLLQKAGKVIEKYYRDGTLSSFVSCFCEEGDVLSQWRGYANDGKGCSLGFSLNELNNYCDKNKGLLRIEKVQYVNKYQLDSLIKKYASDIFSEIETLREQCVRMFKDLSQKHTESLMMIHLVNIIERIILDSLKYKREGFCEEKEWRLFYNDIPKLSANLFSDENYSSEFDRQFDRSDNLLRNQIGFRTKEDVIVPFYPVKFDEISESPVKTLYLGPKNRSNIEDVKLLCEKYLGNVPQIDYSKISYC